MKNTSLLFLISLCLLSCTHKEDKAEPYLHVPSPAWEDQILYFIVTDRFMDGDTTNNDQGEGEYKKGDGEYWNGGDFKGITQKIDYIKELGATGIWITPPVANQWRNPQQTGTGNHGYWASSFVEVDKHYGTLEEYKELSIALHKNDMYLIQDVVCNHLGDFYTYTGPYNPEDVTENFKVHDVAQPTQYPFNHNDANNPEDREMAIYHFAPNFYDHSDTIKKRAYQYADLDDLNTSNSLVRKVLRSSNNHWIKEVGVDGFRFDTPHMVEHEFWHDFLHSDDAEDPGIEKFAQSQGKQEFLTFGETAVLTLPYDNAGPYEAASYLGTEQKPEMTSVLNFPLFSSIQRVFQELKPTSLMTYRLENTEKIFDHPELLLNFIDNHDGARFLTQGSHSSFRQALLFIMTIPGIPIIYYGTEQELLGMRQTMFKGGVDSPDQDHFITDNEPFRFMQHLIRIRKEQAVFRKGKLEVLQDASSGPGAFIYKLSYQEQNALVIFNTSETPKLANHFSTGLEPGTILEPLYSISLEEEQYIVDQQGNLSLFLVPKKGTILLPKGKGTLPSTAEKNIIINPLSNTLVPGNRLSLSGSSKGVSNIKVVIDGEVKQAVKAEEQKSGQWSVQLPFSHLMNGKHRITAFSSAENFQNPTISNSIDFEVNNSITLAAEYTDPVGDDQGPAGTYNYPSHISYTRQMDIREVKVYQLGTNLKVDLKMGEITQIWLPPNGFDHVLVNIYIDLPNQIGAQQLPLQNAKMPNGANWDYLISTAGFGNATFSSEEASNTNQGKAVGPTAFVTVDKAQNLISFLVPSESMKFPADLTGTKLYINTWGGNPGNLRAMKSQPEPWNFSGGIESDPKIMDDTDLIIIK